MGIKGLTTLVREHGKPEFRQLRCDRKEGEGWVLLVDGSSLKYHILSEMETPALSLSGGLNHDEVHQLLVQWLEFYCIRLGFHVHVVCDGGTVSSLQGGSADTFMKRRESARASCAWWGSQWPQLALEGLPLEKRAECVLGSISRATLEHAILSVHDKGGQVTLDTAVEDADTALRAYCQEFKSEIFAVVTNDSDFFVW